MATKTKSPEGLVNPRLIRAVRGLLAIAFGISAYLAWAALVQSGVAGCGPESGCDQVLHSRWSSWLGVPVSFLALVVDAVVFAATFFLGRDVKVPRQRYAWRVLLPGAVAILGAVIWFVALQAFVIKAFCPYCMTAHGCSALAALLILLNTPFRNPEGKPWKVEKLVFVRPALGLKLTLLAGIGLAVLVAGQILHQPKTFAVSSLDLGTNQTAPTATTQPVEHPQPVKNPKPGERIFTNLVGSSIQQPAARITQTTAKLPPPPASPTTNSAAAAEFPLFGGAVQLNLREVPVIGRRDAPHVLVSLYDYSCHHCRIMHGHLQTIRRLFGNDLAIVSLPMPLDPQCNYTVRRAHPDHVNACAYAKAGLAVWRANPAKLEQFDDWIFKPDRPPPPAEVNAYAAQLVGATAFQRAQSDPWINRQLPQDISIYATNYFQYRQGSMPQLIIGSKVISGTLARASRSVSHPFQPVWPARSLTLGNVLVASHRQKRTGKHAANINRGPNSAATVPNCRQDAGSTLERRARNQRSLG